MSKESRKKIELKLVLAAEEVLMKVNKKAAVKIRKVLKTHSRQIAKKFDKSASGMESKKGKSKPKAVTKKKEEQKIPGPQNQKKVRMRV